MEYNIYSHNKPFGWLLIWSSFRGYMKSDLQDIETQYIEKLLMRFGMLLDNGLVEMLEDDLDRSIRYSFTEKEKQRGEQTLNKFLNSPFETQTYAPLDEFETTMLRLSISYFCGRGTISSSTFPADIIKNIYIYMSDEHKRVIVQDLTNYLENSKGTFGHSDYDNLAWQKLLLLLDTKSHKEVWLVNGERECVVIYNNIVYPINSIIKDPGRDTFIPAENISQFI